MDGESRIFINIFFFCYCFGEEVELFFCIVIMCIDLVGEFIVVDIFEYNFVFG